MPMHVRDKLKLRIAQEAARIIVEEGIHDYFPAKQKAAARLGVASTHGLPRNEEIDQALDEYHRIYRADVQPGHIVRLRKLALEAMRFLKAFSPRLVGGVLEGYAGEFSPITLHLFPEAPEDVIRALLDGRIPFSQTTLALPGSNASRMVDYPALSFLVDGVEVQLVLLPMELKQQRLVRKERGLARGGLDAVEALVRRSEMSAPDSA